jgi:DNA-binding NtrC family response regulator
MHKAKTHPILLVSARWQTRAMLAAELGERLARDVVSATSVNEALGLIKLAAVDPVGMVVDAGRRVEPEDVRRLLEAKREVPLVLVVSRLRREAFDGLRERCAAYLERPVRIGTIVESVACVLEDVEG